MAVNRITNPDHPDHPEWGPQNRRKARERREMRERVKASMQRHARILDRLADDDVESDDGI